MRLAESLHQQQQYSQPSYLEAMQTSAEVNIMGIYIYISIYI